MTFDQAQSPRLGQRAPVESISVRMFSGGEVPEAAWPGQLIYINEEQILQVYNGSAWEDVTGGDLGQLTFVGSSIPVSQNVGDVWFNSADNNRMYVAKSVGADEIKAGEWEVISSEAPPMTSTTTIYRQDNPPTAASSPPPKNNDFWYETPINKQYYYLSSAPGTHWVAVRDTGIEAAIVSAITEYSVSSSETVAPTTGWSTSTPTRAPGTFIWIRTTTTRNDGSTSTTNPALMTGNTGATGPTVTITATSQVLAAPAAGGATTPATTTLTGTATSTTITDWQYSVNSAAFSSSVPAGVSRTGSVVTITGATMTAKTIAVKMADAAGVADTLTVAKVSEGAAGGTGADAYTVLLDNESHTFPGTENAAAAGGTTTTVIAYKGATQVAATIGTVTGQVTGLTTAITNNGTTTAGLTITVTTSLVTPNGTLTIPVTVDGQAFSKKFSWSVSRTGVSLTLLTPYYAKVTTGAAAPTVPSVATPLAPWVATEPAYTANTELYRTEKSTYSNATFSYSTVVKVSSYTAATNAVVIANTKTQVFYADGFTGPPVPGWVNPDPIGDPGATAPNQWVPIPGYTVGDVWYQTDDDNHPWFYDGAVWKDARDPNTQLVLAMEAGNANTEKIIDINTQVEANATAANDAFNAAETADGRVSMSDYEPDLNDVPGRNPGSIWFTRTRPRANLSTNPSFELNTTDWIAGGTTAVRTASSTAVDGGYVVRLTNSATVTSHYFSAVAGAGSLRYPCVEGQYFTASIYARYISGLGTGTYMAIYWYNAAGTLLSPSSFGTAIDLAPLAGEVLDWKRPYVTAMAPATAVTFFPRVLAPNANVNDVWEVDGMLIEQEDELGRYFDGDSFDGGWETPTKPHNSASVLEGNKILRVYELHDQDWNRKYFTDDAIAGLDGTKITGNLNGMVLSDNSVAPDKMIVGRVLCSEAVVAGNLVHVWNNNGIFNVRKASGAGYEAHGFVMDSASTGTLVEVYHQGYNPYMTNLVPGVQYLSTTAGAVSGQCPSAVGAVVQRVGFAPSPTVLNFSPMQPVRII